MPRVLIGSIAEMRVSISFAALLVKVTARTPFGLTFPVWMSQAMRVVRTRVLPEPAPARISADWSGRVTAASCSGLRFSRSDIGPARKASFYFSNRRRPPAKSKRRRIRLRRFNDGAVPDLRADFVAVFAELALLLEGARHEFRILLGREIGDAHVV